MTLSGPDAEVLADAVALASRAPSIHNTQPWSWTVDGVALHLYADPTRRLQHADPTGRSLLISCGAALHHVCVAMRARGWNPEVERFPDLRRPAHLARLTFVPMGPDPMVRDLASCIAIRRSDRRPVSSWPVPDEQIEALRKVAAGQGCVLCTGGDNADAADWTELARIVARRHEQQPGYQSELARWIGTSTEEGVPTETLPPSPASERPADERFPAGSLPPPPPERSTAPPRVLLLTASSDDPMSRLRAGEALSAVLLEATRHGLATRVDSQVTEDEEARTLIEDRVLSGTRSPQIFIQVGWPATDDQVPRTPRRALDAVLSTTAGHADGDEAERPEAAR